MDGYIIFLKEKIEIRHLINEKWQRKLLHSHLSKVQTTRSRSGPHYIRPPGPRAMQQQKLLPIHGWIMDNPQPQGIRQNNGRTLLLDWEGTATGHAAASCKPATPTPSMCPSESDPPGVAGGTWLSCPYRVWEAPAGCP